MTPQIIDVLRIRIAELEMDNRLLHEAMVTSAHLHTIRSQDLADVLASKTALTSLQAETKIGRADLRASESALLSLRAETKIGRADLLASVTALTSARAETRVGRADLLASETALTSALAETRDGRVDLLASETALALSQAETKIGQADLLASETALASARAETRIGQLDLLASETALALSQAERKIDQVDLLESETALASSQANYRLLVENMSDMVTRIGRDGVQRYASSAAMRLFGTSPDALVGRNALDFIHPDDMAAVAAFRTQLFTGTIVEGKITYRMLHIDRGKIWVEASIRALVDPDTNVPDGYVSVVRDVTDRMQLAAEREDREDDLRAANKTLETLAQNLAQAQNAAEQSNRAKSRFLAGVSHELRTPLNGILGYAQLLHREGGLTDLQRGRVNTMLEAGRHLLDLINRVLDLSEVEAGHTKMQAVEINVQAVVAACFVVVRPAAETKDLALSFAVTPGTPLELIVDATRFRQILLNLLGNAIKFTAQGGVELRIGTVADRSMLRIEITDTGPGISADHHKSLFQDFERINPDGNAEGAGLGLALSARLAKLMGGQIGHSDNPGGGSVFWLELPLNTAVTPKLILAAADNVLDAEQIAVGILHVLIVDDVAMNREIAASFLRADGHNVTCVEGGAEAVAAVAGEDFDVVLMDVRMPEVDGLEATRRIRALEGARGRVPIVALTAQAFAEQVADCHKAGMDSHLAKPFDPEMLLAVVERAFKVGRQRDTGDNLVALTRPAATLVSWVDPELPVLDPRTFERTTAFLSPEAPPTYRRSPSLEKSYCSSCGRRGDCRASISSLLKRRIRWQEAPACSALRASPR